MNPKKIILGIETSCDETAVAVVQGGEKVLSSIVSSQVNIHQPFGGVVPEVACRAHLGQLYYVLEEALKTSGISLQDISGIAVTKGPGLVGALLIGISFAKGLSLGLNLPLAGVNHIEAHIYSNKMEHPQLHYPFVSLVVSGGHTSLYYTSSPLEYRLLGTTVDDAAGEAFDKVASLLGLSYPGGPSIEKAAKTGNPRAYTFPKSFLSEKDRLEFSFSGIKTSVLYQTRGQDGGRKNSLGQEINIADVAASFQSSVVEVLVEKTIQAARKMNVLQIGLGGGVACNTLLRERMKERGEEEGLGVFFPARQFCTDNGAMIAGLGYHLLEAGIYAPLELEALP